MALVDGGLGGLCGFVDVSLRGQSEPSLLLFQSLKGPLHPGRTLRCPPCIAKSQLNDEPKKNEGPEKRFGIRVPSIPNFSDIEAARRVLESAFQALSFDMPKLPIESALQGLSFDVSRFSIPKQIFIFDITGFVTTKLKRPPAPKDPFQDSETQQTDAILEEVQFPRCAWPRTSVGAGSEQISVATGVEQEKQGNSQGAVKGSVAYLDSLPMALELPQRVVNNNVSHRPSSERSAVVYPHCKWPRQSVQATMDSCFPAGDKPLQTADNLVEEKSSAPKAGATASVSLRGINAEFSSIATNSPHSAWPRRRSAQQFVVTDAPESQDVLYPRSAWPRRSKSGHVTVCSQSKAKNVSLDPITEGAIRSTQQFVVADALESQHAWYPRSAWPRRSKSGNVSVLNQSKANNASIEPTLEAAGRWSPALQKVPQNVIQGGARCAWPRITTPANRGSQVANASERSDVPGPRCPWPRQAQNSTTGSSSFGTETLEDQPQVGTLAANSDTKNESILVAKKSSAAVNDAAAALPRRMLATSVGLSLMNQLLSARGGFILASPADLLGLLPSVSLDIVEEGVTPHLGRRTMVVASKNLLTKP